MDIARPSNTRAKMIKRIVFGSLALIAILTITLALRRMKPAAPTVDLGTIVQDTVKRGPMLLEMHGLGTLVPQDIRCSRALKEALPADVTANLSKVRAEQLAIRLKIEEERMRISEDAAKSRVSSQKAKV